MIPLEKLLSGGDLRSIGHGALIVSKIRNQSEFDILFTYLYHKDRLIVMRAADAIEKITMNHPQYLQKHKQGIIELCNTAVNKELKWHLALLVSRLHLHNNEFGRVWGVLMHWARDKTNSRIVRVNSIQGLSEMVKQQPALEKDFFFILMELTKENIPSLNARIRNLKKKIIEQTSENG